MRTGHHEQMMTIPVFDGHNDFLLRLSRSPHRRDALWLQGTDEGHLDLPRMKMGRFAGGFFAIFVPGTTEGPGRDLGPGDGRPAL